MLRWRLQERSLGLIYCPGGADFIAEFINRGGVLICSRLALGGVVAAAGVEEAEEPEAFHRTQDLVEGGDAQAIEFDGGGGVGSCSFEFAIKQRRNPIPAWL